MKKYLSLAVLLAIIVVLILVVLRPKTIVPADTSSTDSPASRSSSPGSPLDLTYTIDDEPVTLVHGTAIAKDAPDSTVGTVTELFGTPVIGDLGAGKDTSVMFLDQQTSGTGIFFYLVAAYKDPGGVYKGSNAVFLGDRIIPGKITIANGVASANFLTRKDTEPFSADPTVKVTKKFIIKEGELVEM